MGEELCSFVGVFGTLGPESITEILESSFEFERNLVFSTAASANDLPIVYVAGRVRLVDAIVVIFPVPGLYDFEFCIAKLLDSC